jgi:hypothetical protein
MTLMMDMISAILSIEKRSVMVRHEFTHDARFHPLVIFLLYTLCSTNRLSRILRSIQFAKFTLLFHVRQGRSATTPACLSYVRGPYLKSFAIPLLLHESLQSTSLRLTLTSLHQISCSTDN